MNSLTQLYQQNLMSEVFAIFDTGTGFFRSSGVQVCGCKEIPLPSIIESGLHYVQIRVDKWEQGQLNGFPYHCESYALSTLARIRLDTSKTTFEVVLPNVH